MRRLARPRGTCHPLLYAQQIAGLARCGVGAACRRALEAQTFQRRRAAQRRSHEVAAGVPPPVELRVMSETPHFSAPTPHGGALVSLLAQRDEQTQLAREAERYPSIVLDEISECDLVCLATGVFSPLRGFMNRQNYQRCIEAMRLSDGTLWPIPIVLPVGETERAALAQHRQATVRGRDGRAHAILTIEDVFDGDHEREAVGVYGT